MRRTLARALVVAATLGVAAPAHAAPIDDKVQLLRARPTGMDEAQWRLKRREVAGELGRVRSPKAVDALIEVVENERYDSVLSIAMDSLAKQGDPRAIPSLQKIHADRSIDTFIREEAARAIRTLGGTPQDDARLVGGVGTTAGGGGDRVLGGPQLGTMGEASVEGTQLSAPTGDKPFPDKLRARERDIAFVLGSLDFQLNTLVDQQPVLANAGLGVVARYVDERTRWGWSVDALLDADIANGDTTALPNAGGGDDGDVIFFRQGLNAVGDVHVYFGKSDFHAFANLGLSERLTHLNVENIEGGGDESNLTDTRFALDIIPAAGLGWGRYLNAGSDLMVEAVIHALESENILARDLDEEDRKAIRDAVYRRSRVWSSYPRVAAILGILQERGYLARAPGPRLVHRIRSIVEDPSYLERMRGVRVRVGFLYGAPIAQNDFFQRQGNGLGAPFAQFEGGFQLDRERQIITDFRFWYDVIGDPQFTTDLGATYTRFLHKLKIWKKDIDFDDYRGQWFVGVRGGVSQRAFPDLPADVDTMLGYRAIAIGGYAYGFRRGSQISVGGNAGVDSGGFIVGLGLGFRIGLARASVYNGTGLSRGRGRARTTTSSGSAPAAAGAAAEGPTPGADTSTDSAPAEAPTAPAEAPAPDAPVEPAGDADASTPDEPPP